MDAFARLARELHRRSIWQVLGVFLAASWGVVEVVDFLTEQVGLPAWTPTLAFALMLMGLPVVVATAFLQEGLPGADDGPGGIDGPGDGDAGDPNAASDAPAEPVANLAPGTGSLDRPSTRPSSSRRLFTWKNALLGGIGAFTLLGASVFGYFILWTTGLGPMGSLVAQGVFEEGEAVLLAEFDDDTGEELGDVVTEAIRVDLQESEVIRLVPPAAVSQGMARMGRDPDARFTADAARELALRDGIKAVIRGEVAPVGSGYLLTASLVAARSGEILKAFRVPVESDDDILAGIDALSRDIREKSGESLPSIQQGTGLEQATTSSLDALRRYTEAVRIFDEGRQLEAIPLLREALELDPEFAMAWRKLSVIYANQGLEPDLVREAGRKAYELRRRLTDREAILAEAWYLSDVEQNLEGAIDTYRRMLERYPGDPTALNNLAVHLMQVGQWRAAEEPFRRSATGPAPSANSLQNLVIVLWQVGNREEAWAWQDTLAARYPGSLDAKVARWRLLTGEGRWAEAHQVAEEIRSQAPPGGHHEINTAFEMAGSDVGMGRIAEAREHLEASLELAREAGAWELFYQNPGERAITLAYTLEGPEAALAVIEELRARVPLDSLDTRSRVRHSLASWLAALGEVEGGRALWNTYADAFAPEERGRRFRQEQESWEAFEAWGRGDWETAAASLTRLHRTLAPCDSICELMPQWGRTLEEAGRLDEALEKYRWALADAPSGLHTGRAPWRPVILERMARVHASRGETAEARATWEQLVEEFGEGDGPVLAFVDRARAELEALE